MTPDDDLTAFARFLSGCLGCGALLVLTVFAAAGFLIGAIL